LAEAWWFIAGFVIGVAVGVVVGYVLSRYIPYAQAQQPLGATVVFERDENGRIIAIHYVPGATSGGEAS
jgi:uncharacterized membrane-anchored protein YhcB (DUF1043 family)